MFKVYHHSILITILKKYYFPLQKLIVNQKNHPIEDDFSYFFLYSDTNNQGDTIEKI